jgi:ADP-ribose diphosphatase
MVYGKIKVMDEGKIPKVKERRVIFESKKFRVVEKDMEFAGGEQETWEMVEQKGNGGSRALALTDNKELIFVREYRGAAEKYVLRIPTGVIEDEEDPKEAARRELQEETGFVAKQIEPLGVLEPTSGYYKATSLHLFFATDLQQTGKTSREPSELDIKVVLIPLEKAFQMAELAEFEDIQTVYALLLLKKHLSDKKT